MEGRPSYRNIQSDFYTHAHALPPQARDMPRRTRELSAISRRSLGGLSAISPAQVGRCHFSGGRSHADAIDGIDGSWSLPLPSDDGDLAEPLSGLAQALLISL